MKGKEKKPDGKANSGASASSAYIEKMQAMGAPGFRRMDNISSQAANAMSREDFLKMSGVAAAGIGAAAMGIGGVASAAPPSKQTGFDDKSKVPGAPPISVVKMDPYFTYAGSYAPDGSILVKGWPELLQRYILSYETDNETWAKMTEHVDFLYDRMKDLFDEYFKADADSLSSISSIVGTNTKVCLKPNWVTALEDTNPAFISDIQAYNANPQGKAPCGRGAGWGGSTSAPFMAAFMRYLIEDLGLSPDQLIVAEGGDKNEFDWKFFELIGFPIPVTAIYEGRATFHINPNTGKPDYPDPNGTPVWYGGIGFYWARKYLAEKGYTTAMNGYPASLLVDFPGSPVPYIPPAYAAGITLYNSNYLGPNEERRENLVVPQPTSGDWPWNIGVDPQYRTTHIAVHHAFTDSSVGFIFNLPKLKIHMMGNITLALKNIGIGIPAQWATGTDQGGNEGWLYANPPNFSDTHVPCEKFGIAHEHWYGPVDPNGVPEFASTPNADYPWNTDLISPVLVPTPPYTIPNFFGQYDLHKTGSLGGFIMDANLALKSRHGSNILHITDGIVAANFLHEATTTGGSKPLGIDLKNEGIIAMSADPVALDKLMLRYLYKRIPVANYGYPPNAFWNYAFICAPDAYGQLYQSYQPGLGVQPDWTTTETFGLDPSPPVPSYKPGCDNRTPWAVEAGLGKDQYYVVGQEKDPQGKQNAWLGSINGHLVRLRGKSLKKDLLEEVISSNLYYHIFPLLAQFRTQEAYFRSYDTLTRNLFGFKLIGTCFFSYPGCSNNMECLLKNDENGDGVLQIDENNADAFNHGLVSVYANYLRDIILRQVAVLLDHGYPTEQAVNIAALKATFYMGSTVNRHVNPFWNNDGTGGLSHYYLGLTPFITYPSLYLWQMSMGPGPILSQPSVANADWYFYGLTQSLTATDENPQGNPHLLIYGTYGTPITHVAHPTLGVRPLTDFGLPASLPPGTYWPSIHFGCWLTRMGFTFGVNFMTSGDITGSPYWAALQYATAMGYDFKFYVPSQYYNPGLFTQTPQRPNVPPGMLDHVVPLGDFPGTPGYDPSKFFKAYFWAPGKNPNTDPPDEIWANDYKL